MAEEENIGEHDFPRPAPCPKCKAHSAGLTPHVTSKGLQWKVVCYNCGLESKVFNDPMDAVNSWGSK